MSEELMKGNEIIKKLQGEIKNYHAKVSKGQFKFCLYYRLYLGWIRLAQMALRHIFQGFVLCLQIQGHFKCYVHRYDYPEKGFLQYQQNDLKFGIDEDQLLQTKFEFGDLYFCCSTVMPLKLFVYYQI